MENLGERADDSQDNNSDISRGLCTGTSFGRVPGHWVSCMGTSRRVVCCLGTPKKKGLGAADVCGKILRATVGRGGFTPHQEQ